MPNDHDKRFFFEGWIWLISEWNSGSPWQLKANQHPSWNFFLHQLTVQGVVSLYQRPPVAYNCCVSVFQACNARIEPTTLQLIDETCTNRYSSTSATSRGRRNDTQLFVQRGICICTSSHKTSQYCRNYLPQSVSLRNDLVDIVFDGVDWRVLRSFFVDRNCSLHFAFQCFLFLFLSSMGCLCLLCAVFGLIECIYFLPALQYRFFQTINNNK